jgi:hypothetical protein
VGRGKEKMEKGEEEEEERGKKGKNKLFICQEYFQGRYEPPSKSVLAVTKKSIPAWVETQDELKIRISASKRKSTRCCSPGNQVVP